MRLEPVLHNKGLGLHESPGTTTGEWPPTGENLHAATKNRQDQKTKNRENTENKIHHEILPQGIKLHNCIKCRLILIFKKISCCLYLYGMVKKVV